MAHLKDLETIALQYLLEPKPNGDDCFPDFFAEGRSIAIEATSIHPSTNGPTPTPLKKAVDAVEKELQVLLKTLHRTDLDRSYFVRLRIQHDLPKWRLIEKQLKLYLLQPAPLHKSIVSRELLPGVEITLCRADKLEEDCFLFDAVNHAESGCIVVPATISALEHALAKKTSTLAKHAISQKQLWLLVVDCTYGFALCDRDIQQIHSGIRLPAPWTRMILIDVTGKLITQWARAPDE